MNRGFVTVQAQGNAAFSSGKFEEAIEYFTQAIELDPENHVLYSNRSACQVRLNKPPLFKTMYTLQLQLLR